MKCHVFPLTHKAPFHPCLRPDHGLFSMCP